jgi:serine/threonine-protein kinase RsbW
MRESVVITVPSHPKYLSVIRAATITFGKLYGIEEAEVEDIKLAIDEACANVIKHAYQGDTNKKIVVKYTIAKNIFTVIIEDNGLKAQIESMQGRNLNDIRPGGLGIHFIEKVFEGLRFDEHKKKGNRLILTKKLLGNQ